MSLTDLVFFFLLTALALGMVRLVKGPTLADRVVSLDLIAMVFAGMLATFAVRMGQAVYLDALLVLTGVVFLGTVIFARYLDRGGASHD
jgi:multicomponent Na+:H+ antiporter subunit F